MNPRSIIILLSLVLTTHLCGAAIPLSSQPPLTYVSIVKKAAPAVVSISTSQSLNLTNPMLGNDPFFNFFFGNPPAAGESSRQSFARSLGSGVIVNPTGIVVTCGHVVDKATKIIVTLSDNREYEGVVIANDLQNDLVAIQLKDVPADLPLPTLPLEQTDVEVGDILLAIGNPFGVGQTVTSGIVSAIARNVRGRMLIQTDAPINPGNSGGALISMNGTLIGIPNAILSKTGASHGIGFAIPIAIVRTLLDSIKNGGVIIRPWAGIVVQRLTNDMAKSLGMQSPQGVLIVSLHSASPALTAGLAKGDIITTLNGQNISSPEDFIYRIQIIPLGQDITLTIQRNGQTQQISFKPIEPPEIPAADERLIPEMGDLLKGLKVANISPALISRYQLPVRVFEKGVIITDVGNNIMASRLKLAKGDIVEEINHHPIESVEDLFKALPTLQKEESIVIRQGDRRLEVNKN